MPALTRHIKACKWTCLALLAGIIVMACCFAFDLDPYENIHLFLEEMDHFEIDELMIIAVPLAIGIMIDLLHARNLKRQQILKVEQHLETLGSTLHTAQDIINNFLNSIQLYILKAHDEKLDVQDIEKLDELIMNTTQRLSDLEEPILQAEEQTQLNHVDEIKF